MPFEVPWNFSPVLGQSQVEADKYFYTGQTCMLQTTIVKLQACCLTACQDSLLILFQQA